jgi:hypothetical protein
MPNRGVTRSGGGRGGLPFTAGVPRLYQLVGADTYEQGLLSLVASPGVQAYDFTFG